MSRTIEISIEQPTSHVVEVGVDRGTPKPLQDKTVTPTAQQQQVTADSGFYGLNEVTVEGVALQRKTISPEAAQVTVTPSESYIGLSSVTIDSIAYYVNSTINLITSVVGKQQAVTDIETIINVILN